MKKLEQIDPHARTPMLNRWSKRYRNRQLRRMARRNPAAAPKRLGFFGYVS